MWEKGKQPKYLITVWNGLTTLKWNKRTWRTFQRTVKDMNRVHHIISKINKIQKRSLSFMPYISIMLYIKSAQKKEEK
jgi:hypothetical protein